MPPLKSGLLNFRSKSARSTQVYSRGFAPGFPNINHRFWLWDASPRAAGCIGTRLVESRRGGAVDSRI